MFRRAARIDRNQPQIVAALEARGYCVQSLAAVGAGVPDLLVGAHGRTMLLEVKDGLRAPSERRLTPTQQRWHEWWRGGVWLVEGVDQALAVVEAHLSSAGPCRCSACFPLSERRPGCAP
jgi:hypothetical protein